MRIRRAVAVLDTHTEGEPTRIVLGGMPLLKGNSMAEKKKYFEEKLKNWRTFLMREPRGHADMFGAVITEPFHPEADLGVVFMDTSGSLNMCGHGSIGIIASAVKLGWVEKKREIVLESPAGLVRGRVEEEKGNVYVVSLINVPSFLYLSDYELEIPEMKKRIKLDIAFGGNFYAIVEASQLGLEVSNENLPQLIKLGLRIRELLNEKLDVVHPEKEHIRTVELVEFSGPPTHPEATMKNVVIFGEGSVDRSPCGTGTSARIATLYAKGKLKKGEVFVHESITGTLFRAKVIDEVKVGNYKAVIPEITGSAWIWGFNFLIGEVEDPLFDGFLLKRA